MCISAPSRQLQILFPLTSRLPPPRPYPMPPIRGAKVVILDTVTGKVVSRHQLEPGKRVTASAWAHAAAGGRTYTFATAAAEEVTMWTLDPFTGQLAGRAVVIGSVRREYTCLLFSQDSNWLYGGTTSSDVVTINVQRLSVQMSHPVCSSGVGALLTAPDGSGVTIVAGRDGSLSTFNAAGGSWRELRPFATVPGAVSSLTLSSDKSAFLLGTAQGAVLRLDRATLQLSTISQSQGGSLTGVSFAAGQPEAVAVSSLEGSIAVWNMQDFTLQCKAQEPVQAGGALCCVMTRDTIMSGRSLLGAHHKTQPPSLSLPHLSPHPSPLQLLLPHLPSSFPHPSPSPVKRFY
ncbi:hypothetical protein Vafri_13638 [Volvox africanus]|uniref:Uncharacterized protein n=1 Tax=Volvox africanus TaxID=51714 RepID=A0A8J4BDL3_9CHLO|nr:hypothetical protein Vafri_13638 [Volvox africanus]